MGVTLAELDSLYKRSGHVSPTDQIKAKASKLKNVKKEISGITFDSALEARAYQILKLWEAAGAIRDLRMQPTFTLQERFKGSDGKTVNRIEYSADFQWFDVAQNKIRYADAKGHVTQAFTRTLKLMKHRYPEVNIELWTKDTIKELSRV